MWDYFYLYGLICEMDEERLWFRLAVVVVVVVVVVALPPLVVVLSAYFPSLDRLEGRFTPVLLAVDGDGLLLPA